MKYQDHLRAPRSSHVQPLQANKQDDVDVRFALNKNIEVEGNAKAKGANEPVYLVVTEIFWAGVIEVLTKHGNYTEPTSMSICM